MPNTDRLPNYEQMERLIAATGAPDNQSVAIPIQMDLSFVYDGEPHTVRFEDYNTARVMIVNSTNITGGKYVATAYLKGVSDKWADGTTDPKQYEYEIIYQGDTSRSWANASDSEIEDLLTRAQSGLITLSDYGWMVGDERTVSLSAMPALNADYEAQEAQDVTLVLMDSGVYSLVGGGKDLFVVGQKDALATQGKMNVQKGNSGSWKNCDRRTWCNTIYRDAFPAYLKDHFRQFICKTATEYNANTIMDSEDYFALFAEMEVFGKRTYSPEIEIGTLSHINYYKTSPHRIKIVGSTPNNWWLRSPSSDRSGNFCCVTPSGSANGYLAYNTIGLAPFGCL